jgi:hypothetical protein
MSDARALREAAPLTASDLTDDEQELAAPPAWPDLPPDALYGIAGEIAHAACAHSEADPMAVMTSVLVRYGAMVGDGPYMAVGDTRHPARLYGLKVGASSKARKGTSEGPVAAVFEAAEKLLSDVPPLMVVQGPLSSGEGLIYAVRDPSEKVDQEAGQPIDPGVRDKRLLVLEGEYATALRAGQREGNTLSAVLRNAWDHGNLAPLTKTNRITATGAHICLIGHITRAELLRLLSETDVFNGMANRILWLCVRRQKLVPEPRGIAPAELRRLAGSLAERISVARGFGEVAFSEQAAARWRALYPHLSADVPGALGAVTSRAEAQVTRLSLVFALLDAAPLIEPQHLRAALAVWQYCRDSARFIFGDSEVDPVANRILEALAEGPKTQTELVDLFSRRLSRDRLNDVLQDLQAARKIQGKQTKTGGRPRTTWRLADGVDVPSARKAR